MNSIAFNWIVKDIIIKRKIKREHTIAFGFDLPILQEKSGNE